MSNHPDFLPSTLLSVPVRSENCCRHAYWMLVASRLSLMMPALLVDMFTCLFDLPQAGFHMTVLDHVMCPRFHVDHVPCRKCPLRRKATFIDTGFCVAASPKDDTMESNLKSPNELLCVPPESCCTRQTLNFPRVLHKEATSCGRHCSMFNTARKCKRYKSS